MSGCRIHIPAIAVFRAQSRLPQDPRAMVSYGPEMVPIFDIERDAPTDATARWKEPANADAEADVDCFPEQPAGIQLAACLNPV